MEFEWITPKRAAKQWGMSVRQVQAHCANGKIPGVIKLDRVWLIPKSADKPLDGRTVSARRL